MNDSLDRPLEDDSAFGIWLRCGFVAVLLSLSIVSALFAQSVLLRSVPATEESLPAPPKLVLTFNGRVVAHLSSVLLVGGPRNTQVLLSSPRRPDADTLVYPLPTLAPGQYRAQWKVRTVDGQVVDGTLRFTVIEAPR
jgi:methionine-rich copper-binding protein CopC